MGWLTFQGSHLYYLSQGEGPLLILLHGLGGSHLDWQLQQQAFCDDYRVICVDLRGHGRSDKTSGPYSIEQMSQDILTLIEHLACEPVHLLGLSLGGWLHCRQLLSAPS